MLIVIAFADAITKICPCSLLPSTAFLSLWPPHKFSFRLLKYFDPTALPPRHGSYVLIRAPLLGVRTASDLCCRDLLTEVSRFLVHTLCYYSIIISGAPRAVRSPCRVHPHAPSIYLICDRRFLFRGRAGCQELSHLELFGGKRGARRKCAHSFVFRSLDAYVRPKRRESVQP